MSKTKRKINKELLMQKRYWKKIKKRYPFLDPREHWYCAYELTKKERNGTPPLLSLDSGDIPAGWVKRFGHELCEDLRAEFIRCGCLNDVYIVQAKEKYGRLTIYFSTMPAWCKVDDILGKYEELSETVCIHCGSTDAHMIGCGWVCPECRDCYNLHDNLYPYEEKIVDKDRKDSDEVKELRERVRMRPASDILPKQKRKGKR